MSSLEIYIYISFILSPFLIFTIQTNSSKVAYSTDAHAQDYLDSWFGEGVANNDVELRNEFKASPDYTYNFGTAVSYKVITFTNQETEVVLSIRGTQCLCC